MRTKPRRLLRPSDTENYVFFPPEFLPVVAHPQVAARDESVRDRMLVQGLHQYLHFTAVLEQTTVLPVTAKLSAGVAGISLPTSMRLDAFKITTDEAWHAQFSFDFMQQVAEVTGVRPSLVATPSFVGRLRAVQQAIEPSARFLVGLFFAIVSETLVSGLLAEIPNDKRLPAPVRDLVGDHAEDEGRHHAYFRSFLRILWPALSPAEKSLVGPLVPEFVRIFLEPDKGSAARILNSAGFESNVADQIVADCYPGNAHLGEFARAARGTVRAFRDVGALTEPAVRHAFVSTGLITTDAS